MAPFADSNFKETLDRAWKVQDYALGREVIEDALLHDENDPYLRVCYITALGYCSRFQSAQDETSRLFASITREERKEWSAELASMWHGLGRYDIALPLAQEALMDRRAPARMVEIAAHGLEHSGSLDEADIVIRKGLGNYPGHPSISLVKARVLRHRKQYDDAAQILQRIIASNRAMDETKIDAGYELGHVRDSQGLHGQAFQAFCQAKQLQQKQQQFQGFLNSWEKHTQSLEKQTNLPTRNDLIKWSKESKRLADPHRKLAFLVGCPRSGTTLLERVLDSHAGLAATPETTTLKNEVWIPMSYGICAKSSSRLSTLDQLRLLKKKDMMHARETYWQLVPDALEANVDGRVVLDKNPSLFSSLPTIACLFSDSPVLVALRDPRAIAWSCFTQYLPVNLETVSFLNFDTTCRHVAAHLKNWLALRPLLPNPWREVRYESLVHDLAGEARSILEFLGLPWDEEVLRYHENEAHVRSPSYAQASRPIYQESLEKWRSYEEHFDEHIPVLQPAMKGLGYGAS